jgi:hypothetical protein
MARIVEDIIVIKFSKIVKDDGSETDHGSIITPEVKLALEQVSQELVGDHVIVEIERA